MRTRKAIAILILASGMSCRQTATEPKVERTGTPLPALSTLNLEGAWSGAITFGKDYRKPCAPTESIVVRFTQKDGAVNSSFRTNCEGTLRFRGILSGTYFAADLLREDGTSIGKLTGHASSTRISLENRDGAPWDYGDPTIGFELSR